MPVTHAEFETAKKVIQEAIVRHGDLRTALLTIKNKLELEAINKSIKQISDYFVQTRHLKEKMKENQKTK